MSAEKQDVLVDKARFDVQSGDMMAVTLDLQQIYRRDTAESNPMHSPADIQARLASDRVALNRATGLDDAALTKLGFPAPVIERKK